VHYLWAVKKDTLRPFTYAAVFAVLLGVRVWWRYAASRKATAVAKGPERAASA